MGMFRLSSLVRLVALSLSLIAHHLPSTSVSVYSGAYVQFLLRLPSPDRSGFYSGWLFSAFMVGNVLCGFAWGTFADKAGRKPVIIVGVCAVGACSISLGLSTTLTSAIVTMLFLGMCDYIVPMAKIVVVELLSSEDAVIGMTILPGSRAIGLAVGPVIGGFLAEPAVYFPSRFSSTGIFGRYPFLLPNLVVACLAFAILPLVYFSLPETLETSSAHRPNREPSRDSILAKNHPDGNLCTGFAADKETDQKDLGHSKTETSPLGEITVRCAEGYGSSRADDFVESLDNNRTKDSLLGIRAIIDVPSRSDEAEDKLAPNALEEKLWFGPDGLLACWRLRSIVYMEFIFMVVRVGFEQFYPLWLLASVASGGLQWDLSKIGTVLGSAGFGLMLFQFIAYPMLCRTVGIVRLLYVCIVILMVLFLAIPDLQHLSWSTRHSYLVGVTLRVLVESSLAVLETAIMLASTKAVPAYLRGRFGGLIAVVGACGRATSPPVLCSLLAWSLHSPAKGMEQGLVRWIMSYHLVFLAQSFNVAIILFLGLRIFTSQLLTSVDNIEATSRRDGKTLVENETEII